MVRRMLARRRMLTTSVSPPWAIYAAAVPEMWSPCEEGIPSLGNSKYLPVVIRSSTTEVAAYMCHLPCKLSDTSVSPITVTTYSTIDLDELFEW